MRTRTSNRQKRFTAEKYDFGSGSEEAAEEEETPHLRRQRNADEQDENFEDESAAAAEGESPDDEDEGDEEASVSSDASASKPDARERDRDKFYRQTVRRIKPFNVRADDAPAGYVSVEPIPPEGFIGRAYVGPFERHLRGDALVDEWYGPLRARTEVAQDMLDRWMGWTVLPPKDTVDGDGGVWVPDLADREAYFAEKLAERLEETYLGPDTAAISPEEAEPYQLPSESMPVLVGPYPDQRDIRFKAGEAHTVSQPGLPYDEDDNDAKIPTGWLLDTGGIPLSLDWKPQRGDGAQLLAVAVIPHHDQDMYNYQEESTQPDFQKYGTVQLWEFAGERLNEDTMRPSKRPPKLQKTLCFDHGRARRVKWNPAYTNLAILCGDGSVCVVAPGEGGNGDYERVQDQAISLELADEPDIKASAMAWVNVNRLAVGYSDGSIALWSIHPMHLLLRHPVHHNDVVGLASGYPTMPYLVASYPLGGDIKLLDLQAPSHEATEVHSVTINAQPDLVAYSDHLLGFFCVLPSASPLNTALAFMHHAHFPVARHVFSGDCFTTCLAVARRHPYLLVGASDGSLWALNPLVELFSTRREPTDRLRVLQHEHRPARGFPEGHPAGLGGRGAARVLHGFAKDKNSKKTWIKGPGQKPGKRQRKRGPAPGGDEDEAEAEDPTKGVVHEGSTRITAVEWNPNGAYGCWAAVGMGSGLVRVIDLGLELPRDDASL